jgi:hypothetical protein
MRDMYVKGLREIGKTVQTRICDSEYFGACSNGAGGHVLGDYIKYRCLVRLGVASDVT